MYVYDKLYIVCSGAVAFLLPGIISAKLFIPVINQSINQHQIHSQKKLKCQTKLLNLLDTSQVNKQFCDQQVWSAQLNTF